MNCKPGDLARVVGGSANRDRLVSVLDDDSCDSGEWRCKALQSMVEYVGARPTGRELPAGAIVWAMDSSLRPIRDPGEHAVDEMVRRVPLPLPEIIPAMLDREVEHG